MSLLETLSSSVQSLWSQHPVALGSSLALLASYSLLRYFVVNGVSTNGEQADMRGKTVLITGATSGIGTYTAQVLYRQGATVYLACRNAEKTRQVMKQIQESVGEKRLQGGSLNFIRLDLNDLESVRDCAKEFLQLGKVLDLLINNAGCISLELRFSKQGYEEMFQSNALGHHLLIELLWNNLNSNPNGARIVIVASLAHSFVSDADFYDKEQDTYTMGDRVIKPTRSFSSMKLIDTNKKYGMSKLFNVYQTYHFNERIKNTPNCKVTINCCHPGAIATGLTREAPLHINLLLGIPELLFFKNVKQGSQNTIHLACSPDVKSISGKYFDDCRPTNPTAVANNTVLQKAFIDFCEPICSQYSL